MANAKGRIYCKKSPPGTDSPKVMALICSQVWRRKRQLRRRLMVSPCRSIVHHFTIQQIYFAASTWRNKQDHTTPCAERTSSLRGLAISRYTLMDDSIHRSIHSHQATHEQPEPIYYANLFTICIVDQTK